MSLVRVTSGSQPKALIGRAAASNSHRSGGGQAACPDDNLTDFAFILVLMILLNTFALVSFAAFLCF